MISAARSMLKHLAKSSQRIGRGGEAEAQYLLGNCYGMGALGWPINHQLAFQWYTQASKQDHAEGTYRTAVCYELGLGTSKDGARALIFYKKAAVLRHVPSMYKLGIIHMRGYYGQAVSKREAVTWLQRATAGTGSDKSSRVLPHALHALALIQLSGECGETSLISDTKYAMKLLHDAANMGYAPSQTKLGECYECGHFCPVDEGQSLYWYTQAARQDYPEAALALSGWYLTGSLKTQSLLQSDTEAYLWARRAVTLIRQQHQTKSVAGKIYYALGVYHENGIGVRKSAGNAMKWYKRAASAGHPGAYRLISSY
ncbi:HCP-like protein [Backusella circina FSU 941]|nr:HCP-like protein [Backusella circina FSU 941]